MSLNTYLTFNDNCRQVFDFYRSVFGGEFDPILTFREGPPDMEVAEDEQDRIMHVSLPIGSSVLMGSDSCSAFGPPPTAGNNFSISFSAESRNDADDKFAKLSQGGQVTMPLPGHVLGLLLRLPHRPVRHKLAGKPHPPAAGVMISSLRIQS